MTRHISDQPRATAGNARLRAFTGQDRENATHPAIETLRRRPRDRDETANRKMAEFARIERETH